MMVNHTDKSKYSNSNECIQFIKDGLDKLSEEDRIVVLSHRESFELIEQLQEAVAYLQDAAAKPQTKKPVTTEPTKPAATKPAQSPSKTKTTSGTEKKPAK